MKILVTGAGGLLGSEIVRLGGARRAEADADDGDAPNRPGGEPLAALEVVGLDRGDLDVTDAAAAQRVIAEHGPEWVVHCAAYTAVDRAEEEAEEAMRVNHGGTVNVAAGAAAVGARLVYFSTDYVFDGRKRTPYRPDDAVAPLSVYARTKLAGEGAALAAGGAVVRAGWLYGAGGRNFVEAILDRAERGEPLRVVDDQRGRPTWAHNVADVVLELIRRGWHADGAHGEGQVWHVADRGEATWRELAQETIRLSGIEAPVEGVSSKEWGAAATRPEYSVLDLTETERYLDRPMMAWPEALRRYLETR